MKTFVSPRFVNLILKKINTKKSQFNCAHGVKVYKNKN